MAAVAAAATTIAKKQIEIEIEFDLIAGDFFRLHAMGFCNEISESE